MANTILTPTMVLREALRVLHNHLVFIKNVNREYSNESATQGAKIGSVANVRLPNRYFVSDGPQLSAQTTTETTIPVTIQYQKHVDVNFTSADSPSHSITSRGASLRLPWQSLPPSSISPASASCASWSGTRSGQQAHCPGRPEALQPAWPNTTPPRSFLNAGLMDSYAAPRDENRRICFSPMVQALSVNALAGLFQDSGEISKQYRKGIMGTALGFEFAMDQNINLLTTGARTSAGVVNGAGQVGTNLVSNGWAGSQTNILAAGEIIQVAGITGLNPENQQTIGIPGWNATFVVTANCSSDANGNIIGGIPISPSIVVPGATVANATVSGSPANGAAITLLSGSANSQYQMNIAYHQDAFTLATVDLDLPNGVDFAAREQYDGISMRIVRAYDINNDQFPCRIDTLFGPALLRGGSPAGSQDKEETMPIKYLDDNNPDGVVLGQTATSKVGLWGLAPVPQRTSPYENPLQGIQMGEVVNFFTTQSPASVAANTTAEQTFTVTGLATTDFVFAVNKPTAQAGLGIVNWRIIARPTRSP